jgi:hypothetical protein
MKSRIHKEMAIAVVGIAGALPLFSIDALAQQAPIERIKMSDNELNCAQLHAEAGAMDKAAADARGVESQGNTTTTAAQAGNVAAEVAGRTGLFGALGGLTGALFGQVAAQTAAGVAQQSGQMTAQQAAERARQAGARKEHVTALFINRGCKTTDLAFNPPASATAPAPVQLATAAVSTAATAPAPAVAPPAAIQALPDLDPDNFFKGANGGTFGKNVTEVLPGNKRVAVAGFRVAFITSNTATAQVRGSYLPGRDTSGASSTLVVTLAGVDHATMQALTDRAYADFLAQMRLTGREILPQEDLREFLAGVDVSPSAPGKPYTKEVNSQTAMVFSPTGMPLWFHNGDIAWSDKGPFDQKNLRSLAEYSNKLNAIVVAPLIVVDFARMSSSGNQSGLVSNSAETGAALEMRVSGFTSRVTRSEETRGGLVMKGDDAHVSMTRGFVSDMKFGAMKDVAASDNRGTVGIFNVLGGAMGLANAGGAVRNKKESVAETNNSAYAAAALDALTRATGTFAKWFQKYPAK